MKRIILALFLVITSNSLAIEKEFLNNFNPEISILDDSLTISHLEYDEGLLRSKKDNKPLLIYFTGNNVVNVLKIEFLFLKKERISSFINEQFIFLELNVDDDTELPENLWIEDLNTGEKLKTKGKQNLNLERGEFSMDKQPYFIILNSEERVFGKCGYQNNEDNFMMFLVESLERYESSITNSSE